MFNYKDIYPVVNADNNFFWEGCRQRELRFQICSDCKLIRWPPSFLCPNCLSTRYDIYLSNGEGRIFSYIVYHKAYHKSLVNETPYVTAIIKLEEGVKFLSRILIKNFDNIECEKTVELVWDNISEVYPIPLFQIIGEQQV
ncbi:MAG: OB-fold domain-containing protein [Anaerolineaceae bacterium]|jgi:uncharacterized OB-fold protein|nr:OB-fold domain-containing protein [Anaerolineaceae bacterium]